MSVPAPSIAPQPIPGSTYTLAYEGPIGVAGVDADLNVSLMAFPELARVDPHFREQLCITFQSENSNLFYSGPAVLPDAAFTPVPGTDPQPNEYVQIVVTSDFDSRPCLILINLRHTYTR